MKENTNNKIAFCWGCYSPLTGDKLRYCNPDCEMAKGKRTNANDLGFNKIWVYLNKGMLDLAKGQGIEPHAFSAFIHTGHDLMGIAMFDRQSLETIGDNERNTYDAYYREITALFPHPLHSSHDEDGMREVGLLGYLSDNYGITTEKNIAQAIGTIVGIEDLTNPIELFNTL